MAAIPKTVGIKKAFNICVFPWKMFYGICYKLVEGFRVTCLLTGQYNTKGYDTITDFICTFGNHELLKGPVCNLLPLDILGTEFPKYPLLVHRIAKHD